MVYQMVQEGALWPSVMVRFGPHWGSSEITWANIVNAEVDVGTKNITIFNVLTWFKLKILSKTLVGKLKGLGGELKAG